MAGAKFYNKSGNTTLSNRGKAVRKMCEATNDCGGVMSEGYKQWRRWQRNPIGPQRYYQIVREFNPLLAEGVDNVFDMLDRGSLSYTDALKTAQDIRDILENREYYSALGLSIAPTKK